MNLRATGEAKRAMNLRAAGEAKRAMNLRAADKVEGTNAGRRQIWIYKNKWI